MGERIKLRTGVGGGVEWTYEGFQKGELGGVCGHADEQDIDPNK